MKKIHFYCFLGISLLSFSLYAATHPTQQASDKIINQLYHSLEPIKKIDMIERLDRISGRFLGEPYQLGALGEGIHGRYDQAPRYRTDAFDCETYVTTMLSLTLATDLKGFKRCLSQLRYANGQVSYTQRNHFTDLDWNLNNQHKGFIRDITPTFLDKTKRPIAQIATAYIDKPSWYQHFTMSTIRLRSANKQQQATRLQELKSKGSRLPKTKAYIAYLPLARLFNAQKEPEHYLFAQIPNGAIIEIVRPNWDLQPQIGTHLNVSHLGFVFWKQGQLVFRHASSNDDHVVDVSLTAYLKQALENNPTIQGINVQVLIPQTPSNEYCL